MRYAFIHGLYGEDFVQEAISSIADQVDQVLFFWADKPWRGVPAPEPVDNMLFKAMQLDLPNVRFIKFSPEKDEFSMMYAARDLLPRDAEYIVHTNGTDVIQVPGNVEATIREMHDRGSAVGVMRQRWLWKDLHHEAVMGNKPSGSFICNMKHIGWEPVTLLSYFNENAIRTALFERGKNINWMSTMCWNTGYAYSERLQRLRLQIRRAQVIAGMGYQPESEEWLEKWCAWTPDDERTPEPPGSIHSDIHIILPLPSSELPLALQKRLV